MWGAPAPDAKNAQTEAAGSGGNRPPHLAYAHDKHSAAPDGRSKYLLPFCVILIGHDGGNARVQHQQHHGCRFANFYNMNPTIVGQQTLGTTAGSADYALWPACSMVNDIHRLPLESSQD